MANNLIRVKQLDQSELSGFFAQTAVNTGIIPSIVNSIGTGIFVSVSGDQNVSGTKTFFNSINISGDLTVNGTIRANEIIDFTVTGDISGYTGQFQALFVKGEPVVTGFAAGFAVLLYGDQTISGIKTFDDDINISGDLTLNGGLYINNLEEINISGTILNSGIRLANLNDLTATGSVLYTYITQLSGDFDTSGSILNSYINNLSGDFNETGALLNNYINSLSGYINSTSSKIVFTTGNQTISGNKTFVENTKFGDTGQGDFLVISGNQFIVYGSGNFTSGLFVNGNPVLTGVNLGPYATVANLASTGSTLDIKINNLSGYVTGVDGTFTTNLATTGSTLNTKINTLSGYVTGTNLTFTTNLATTGSTLDTKINTLSGYVTGVSVLRFDDQTISGVKTFISSGIFSLSGAAPLGLPNNPLSIVGSGNTYLQVNIQNRATGRFASADLVITANNGTDTSNFINLGINNSGYNDPAFTNGTGLDGYLFIDGGNLDIGTRTAGKFIEFHAGGTVAGSTIARISQSGLNITSGNLTVGNTGVILSGQNVFQITFNHDEMNMNNGTFYISDLHGLDASTTSTQRRMTIMQASQARYASWSTYTVSAREQDSTTIKSTGYFVNNTTNTSGMITDQLAHTLNSTLYTFTGAINPPVNVNFGDQVQLELRVPNYAIGMGGVNNAVEVYFYS